MRRVPRIRSLLAADRPRGEVRSGSTEPGTGQGGRPSEDGSAGRHEAGAQLSRRGSDRGLGAQRGTRGAAGSGASPRGSQAGSVAGATSTEQISFAPRPASAIWDQGMDAEV